MLHLGLLQSLKYSHMSQIYSGLPRCHDSLSTKNEIIQTGESSSLIFYLIYIVCQIPMVQMFATNMSYKLPFYVASPGCKCSEHRWIKHLVGGSGLLGLLSYTTYSKKSLNKWTPGAKWLWPLGGPWCIGFVVWWVIQPNLHYSYFTGLKNSHSVRNTI